MSAIAEREAQAKAKAFERVAKILQRPDQLEKVEEYRKREARQKASKESLLKTALQQQLEGVRSGLEIFKVARQDIKEVGKNLSEINQLLKGIPKTAHALSDVREESTRHTQYAMAMENMANLFSINQNLEKADTLIKDGNLLHAHIRMSELEASRDELLFELFRVGNKSEHTMLLDYFSDVEKLSKTLEEQIIWNLKRTIATVRKDPKILVTTLRIIEREEKLDATALQRHQASGFLPPGRPRKWKVKAFEILEGTVSEQLEGCQLDTREESKVWLARYLEVIRQKILETLLVVKFLCVPCFPPSYDILNRYVMMYHRCLSRLIQDVIVSELKGNDIVILLDWILNTYEGPELLRNAQLDLNNDSIPKDLLSNEALQHLKREYLATTASNYRSWRMNTLSKEVEEWASITSPPLDNNGHFHTEAPIIIFQMVDENLQVAKTVSVDLVQEALLVSLDMIREYGQAYQEEVREFKEKYFEDRSKVKNFTQFMIAIINNCLICIELAQKTKDKYWKSAVGVGDSKAITRFESVLQTFESLSSKAANYLLEEPFLDLEPYFQKLIRSWLKSTVEVDTICMTLADYFHDYDHLKPKNFEQVMKEAKTRVAREYLTVLMSRKIALKTPEERREAFEKISREKLQLKSLFENIEIGTAAASSHQHAGVISECPFNALDAIAEVIKVDDLDILSLELHSFIKKYPDVTKEQLLAILNLRGDLGRSDAKQKATEIIPGESVIQKGPIPLSIFSQIQVPASLF